VELAFLLAIGKDLDQREKLWIDAAAIKAKLSNIITEKTIKNPFENFTTIKLVKKLKFTLIRKSGLTIKNYADSGLCIFMTCASPTMTTIQK
jgi:hypothetical protein